MTLAEKVRTFIEREKLFLPTDHLLLAISGGLDSVVLAHLLREMGYDFALAHYNFGLRGKASEEDEAFVRQLGEEDFKVAVFTEGSSAEAFASEQGISIQEAARQLRYTWFHKLRKAHGFSYVLTAHHLDDNVETFLLNFLRGTGPIGLAGILPLQRYIARPLLECSRGELEAYAKTHQLSWREDGSNAEEKYRRNYLRHNVLPHLRQLQPAWERVMSGNFANLRQGRRLYQEGMDARWRLALNSEGHLLKARLPENAEEQQSLLIRYLSPYGFTPEQCRQLLVAATGSRIQATHRKGNEALPSASEIKLYLEAGPIAATHRINALPGEVSLGAKQLLQLYRIPRPHELRATSNTAYLSLSATTLPLTLRHWVAGDRFQPFGMGGKKKKLQDFFTDLKLDRFQKDRVWLLENADGEILWVVGYRLGEPARVRDEEDEVIAVHLM